MIAFRTCFSAMMCVSGFSGGQSTKAPANSRALREAAAAADRPHANDPDPTGGFASAICRPTCAPTSWAIRRTHTAYITTGSVRNALLLHRRVSATARPSALRRTSNHWRDVHALSDDTMAGDDPFGPYRSARRPLRTRAGPQILACARSRHGQVSYLDYSTTTASLDGLPLTTSTAIRAVPRTILFRETLSPGRNYWTYNPSDTAGPRRSAESERQGDFGSFNSYYRVTAQVLGVWSRLLQSIPGSRFVRCRGRGGLDAGALLETLTRAGVAATRFPARRGPLREIPTSSCEPWTSHSLLFLTTARRRCSTACGTACPSSQCRWGDVLFRMACSILGELGLSELIARRTRTSTSGSAARIGPRRCEARRAAPLTCGRSWNALHAGFSRIHPGPRGCLPLDVEKMCAHAPIKSRHTPAMTVSPAAIILTGRADQSARSATCHLDSC